MAAADATATVVNIMKEIVDLIVNLARRVGELLVVNKELQDENERLKRQIEGLKPFIHADADASAAVAKK